MLKAISLFSGVGGFEIGLGRAGIDTVLQVESDPWCLSVLERHWPDVERIDDVRRVCVGEPAERSPADGLRSPVDIRGRQTWARLPGNIDLVYGGFPCQDLSVAGKRAGLSGERSGLWHEFRRVLSELRPRWTLIENVPGLLSSNGGADFGVLLRGLDDLGYGVAWRVLDARWFGVPQRRRRVFIVGCLGDARRAAQVLAVCESCGGHSQTRRQAWQDVAPTLDDGARRASVELPMIAVTLGAGGHSNNPLDETLVAATLSAGGHPGSNLPGRHHEDDDNLVVANSLQANQGDGRGWSGDRGDGSDNLIVERDVTAFDWQASAGNDESWRGKGRQHVVRSGDYAGAVSATRTDAVFGSQIDEDSARPLVARASGYRMDMESENFVVATNGSDVQVSDMPGALSTSQRPGHGDFVVAGPVRASDGHHGHSSPRGDGADNLITFSSKGGGGGAFEEEDLAPTLVGTDGNGGVPPAIAQTVAGFYTHRGQNHDTAYTEDGSPPILSTQQAPGITSATGVRRLTPLECERLQGWPDRWTELAADGKHIPDSHRYRCIGNGVVAPVAEWIGHRLVLTDSLTFEGGIAI